MAILPTRDQIKNSKKYFLLGTGVFVIGLVWHFPLERFQRNFTKAIEKQTGIQIESEKVSLAFPLGLRLMRSTIKNVPIGEYLYDFDLDEIKLSVGPISAITFALKHSGSASFYIRQKEAKITGVANISPTELGAEVDGKKIHFEETFEYPDPLNREIIKKVPVKSTLGVQTKLKGNLKEIEAGNFSSLTGQIKLNGQGTTIEAPILGLLEFNQVSLEAKANKGLVTISSLNLSGPQINGKTSGTINLKPAIDDSELKLDSKLTFGEKGTQIKSLISTLGSAAGLKLDDSGALVFKITGTPRMPEVKGY